MDKKVIKRNGNKVNFDDVKIFNAIWSRNKLNILNIRYPIIR